MRDFSGDSGDIVCVFVVFLLCTPLEVSVSVGRTSRHLTYIIVSVRKVVGAMLLLVCSGGIHVSPVV